MAEFCGQCGARRGERDHTVCDVRLVLEPPRFCSDCARRMKVQVSPRGWTAVCVEHGTMTG